MAEIILNGKRFIDILPEEHPSNYQYCQYCVAMVGKIPLV